MDVMDGSPSSIFSWFFEAEQTPDETSGEQSEFLIMLHGTSDSIKSLVELCVENQDRLNDALGQQILLAFFSPDQSPQTMHRDASLVKNNIRRTTPVSFVYASPWRAYPLSDGLKVIGSGDFRSEKPGETYFAHLAKQIAKANAKAVPFFQTALNLDPLQDYALVAIRETQEIRIYGFYDKHSVNMEDLLQLIGTIRAPFEGKVKVGQSDWIDIAVKATILRGSQRAAFGLTWKTIKAVLEKLHILTGSGVATS